MVTSFTAAASAMRRVVDPRNPCWENTCTAALRMAVLVSIGRGTYPAASMCASGYLLTSFVWWRTIRRWTRGLNRTDPVLCRHGILARNRGGITGRNPFPAERPGWPVEEKAIGEESLGLPKLSRLAGIHRWQWLHRLDLIEERDVREYLLVRRRHFHSKYRRPYASTTRQPELRALDEI